MNKKAIVPNGDPVKHKEKIDHFKELHHILLNEDKERVEKKKQDK
ncbi:hypothetical protein PASE110613_13345 [Paenibacillus sediminis]|uniref:Uncharacterized protein n=1 Tax=Paenibacillus sediminis TaxID=664909 RepID=A0ABS4H3Q9_9BACL|nr:hypothetical protein [Paenibacillus sediminis]MBP1937159.1 hypothetical protein [Paenibacillus sediminis]